MEKLKMSKARKTKKSNKLTYPHPPFKKYVLTDNWMILDAYYPNGEERRIEEAYDTDGWDIYHDELIGENHLAYMCDLIIATSDSREAS